MADSDDLIRQAKESLGSEPDRPPRARREPTAEPELEYEPEPEELVRPAPEPVYEQRRMPQDPFAPEVDRRQRGRKIGSRIGMVILGFMAVFWALVGIGIAVNPTDVGSTIMAMLIITALPIAIGVYLVRKGREG